MKLHLEALEDRTVPSGNVTASLMPSGLLQVHGDIGNNHITIWPSPSEPGDLRIQGDAGAFTTINGGVFADFADAPTTGISVSMLDGNDSVTVHDLTIPGNLTVAAGAGTESLVVYNFKANIVQFTAQGPGADTASLDAVQAGLVAITTGSGGGAVTLNSVNLGTATIDTSPATTAASVHISGNSVVGNLGIQVGNGGSVVSVADTLTHTVAIAVGNDSSSISLYDLTVVGGMNLTVGTGASAIGLTTVSVGTDLNLTATGAPNRLSLTDVGIGHDLNLTIGDNTGLADVVSLTSVSVGNDLTLTAGTADFQFSLTGIAVGNDLNFTSGDGNNTAILTDIAVADSLTIRMGAGINSMSAENVTAFFGMIDGGSGSANVFEDLGGNFGFYVTDFVGYQ